MEIRSLQYFVEICDSMSFSAAAQKLFITQQALSKAVKRMEEELNEPLLHRYANNIELTEFGERFLVECRALLGHYEGSMRRIRQLSDYAKQNVTAAYASGAITALGAHLLCDFKRQYPLITLHAEELPDYTAEKKVDEGLAEIGFTAGPPLKQDRFQSHLLFHSEVCLIVHFDHPLAARDSIRIEDLRGLPLIGRTDEFQCSRLLEGKCQAMGFQPQYLIRSTNPLTDQLLLRKNIAAGMGLIHLATPKMAQNRQKILYFEEPGMDWDIYLIHIKNHQLSTAGRIFADFYLKNANRGLSPEKRF